MLSIIILSLACVTDPTLPGEVVARVSGERAKQTVEKLTGFGTRHTLSETGSPERGIGAAREWIRAQMSECRGVEAGLESFKVPPMARLPQGAEVVNVVGVLKGSMPEAADRRYYVVGHYDSINGDRMDAEGLAPGANDDASGVAVVLECARALAGVKLDATVVFLCTAAEEQGLVGAKAHAESAAGRGEHIMGVLNNDIVGDPSVEIRTPEGTVLTPGNTTVRVFSEGVGRNAGVDELSRVRLLGAESDSASRELARFVAYVSVRERTRIRPMLVYRADRFLRGGDHSAFNDAGYAAVRFSVPAEDYSRQHANVVYREGETYGDVPAFVSGEYVADVARLNAATLVHLANSPRPPANARMITAHLERGTTLRWEAPPEPDTAGYEVVWRLTTDADWTGSADAGNVLEWSSPASKDNYFFGVRAYDREGYRSPVAFAGAAEK